MGYKVEPISLFDITTATVHHFPSNYEAALKVGCSRWTISKLRTGRCKRIYDWCLLDNAPPVLRQQSRKRLGEELKVRSVVTRRQLLFDTNDAMADWLNVPLREVIELRYGWREELHGWEMVPC